MHCGSQSVGGKRAFNGFKDRTLPHYPRGDKTPAGKVCESPMHGCCKLRVCFPTCCTRIRAPHNPLVSTFDWSAACPPQLCFKTLTWL